MLDIYERSSHSIHKYYIISPLGLKVVSNRRVSHKIKQGEHISAIYGNEEESYLNTESPNNICADTCGTMPSCAPLAVPYVPFQQTGSRKYSQEEALNNGTLFPGLNLPFKAKVKARDVVSGPLSELQALEFVIVELGLYLNTHPDDKEAFALFQKYVAMAKEGRERYEAMFGPLTLKAAAASDCYSWLADPWPWNYPEGGRK